MALRRLHTEIRRLTDNDGYLEIVFDRGSPRTVLDAWVDRQQGAVHYTPSDGAPFELIVSARRVSLPYSQYFPVPGL